MKKPEAVILTDAHLNKSDHVGVVTNAIEQAGDLCIKIGCKTILNLGDNFTNRKAINLDDCLLPFNGVLDKLHERGLVMHNIPGNHDKTDQSSAQSYLDPFAHHPAHRVYPTGGLFFLGKNIVYAMLPFFTKDIYLQHLEELIIRVEKLAKIGKPKLFLGTHIAVNGVRNNDGSLVTGGIGVKAFKIFDRVHVGHYHDQQDINDKIRYIGSLTQRNFGEDTNKGFTVLFNDGSEEFIKSDHPNYRQFKYDLDVVNMDKVEKMFAVQKKLNKDGKHFVRFVFTGHKNNTVKIDVDKFKKVGFEVEIVNIDLIQNATQIVQTGVRAFKGDEIKNYFDAYAKDAGIDADSEQLGKQLLNKYLK